MKAVRKPIVDEVWQNVDGADVPDWVEGVAEANHAAGKSFMVKNTHGHALCRSGDWMIKGPTNIYPCSQEGFSASYDLVRDDVTETQEGNGEAVNLDN